MGYLAGAIMAFILMFGTVIRFLFSTPSKWQCFLYVMVVLAELTAVIILLLCCDADLFYTVTPTAHKLVMI